MKQASVASLDQKNPENSKKKKELFLIKLGLLRQIWTN